MKHLGVRNLVAAAVLAAVTVGGGSASYATFCEDMAGSFGISSVRCFGAVGDGVHDDTQAFSAAIAYGTASLVRVPAGHYRLTLCAKNATGATLTPFIVGHSVVVEGDGQGSTFLEFYPADSTCLQAGSVWSVAPGLYTTFRGFTMRRYAAFPDTGAYGYSLNGDGGNSTLDRVTIDGWGFCVGVDPAPTDGNTFTMIRSEISHCTSQAIITGPGPNTVIKLQNNDIHDNRRVTPSGSSYGLYARAPFRELSITDNQIHDNDFGIHRFGCTGDCTSPGTLIISRNNFYGLQYVGLLLDGSYEYQSLVTNNKFGSTGNICINVASDNVLISGNVFACSQAVTSYGGKSISVTGNIFALGSDPNSSNTYVGVGMGVGTGWLISGNTFNEVSPGSYAITMDATTLATISNNVFNLHGAGVYVRSGADNFDVVGNTFNGNDMNTGCLYWVQTAPRPASARVKQNSFKTHIAAYYTPGVTFEGNYLAPGTELRPQP